MDSSGREKVECCFVAVVREHIMLLCVATGTPRFRLSSHFGKPFWLKLKLFCSFLLCSRGKGAQYYPRSASVRENGTHTWVVGDGSMWMFHQGGSKSSAGHVQIRWFGRRLVHRFARIRHKGQRSRSSFVSLWRSLFRKRRLEEFLQCENERLQTPSEQRRQRESAGCRRPSTVWEMETQKPRRLLHTRQIE